MIADHVGEPMPSNVTTRQAVQSVLDEIAELEEQRGEADEEAGARLAARGQLADDAGDLRLLDGVAYGLLDLLAAIRLHVNWRTITVQLTTQQRELFADAVEAADQDAPVQADRWWRDNLPAEHPNCTRTGMCQERHDHAPECLSQYRTDAELANGVYPDDAELAGRRAAYEAST
jgi:hypothetical protein